MSFTQTPPTSNSFLESTETIFSTPVGMRPVQPAPPPAYTQSVPPMPVHEPSSEAPLNFDVPDHAYREPASPGTSDWAAAADSAATAHCVAGLDTQQGGDSSVDLSVLQQLQHVTKSEPANEVAAVSKVDLAGILEGFARVLRGDVLSSEMTTSDHSGEIAQMKELLLEAQETIITLLNDRVFDRAKIARLEAEVRLMPDLQAQAHRAMGLAMRSEDFHKELSDVRSEMERLRASYVRNETATRTSRSLWQRIFGQDS